MWPNLYWFRFKHDKMELSVSGFCTFCLRGKIFLVCANDTHLEVQRILNQQNLLPEIKFCSNATLCLILKVRKRDRLGQHRRTELVLSRQKAVEAICWNVYDLNWALSSFSRSWWLHSYTQFLKFWFLKRSWSRWWCNKLLKCCLVGQFSNYIHRSYVDLHLVSILQIGCLLSDLLSSPTWHRDALETPLNRKDSV